MDPDALDRMNDFFDFAALEHNTEADNTHASSEQIAPSFQPGNVTAIDWAMEPAPQDTLQLYDLPMYDVAHDLSTSDINQQRPPSRPTAYLATSMIEMGVDSRADVNWQTIDVEHAKDHRMRDATDLALPPSLSSLALMQCDDEGSLTDAPHSQLGLRLSVLDQSITPTDASLELEQLPVRSVASQQQPSIATWKPASAKRKGPQCRISLEARQVLEDEFAANPYPCAWELDIIAHQANLDVKKVRNWFNNTRARKKCGDSHHAIEDGAGQSDRTLKTKLSKDSLESLQKRADDANQLPQPPLAVYLAQSYQEEAVELSAVQAAVDVESLNESIPNSGWSGSRQGRRGSVITSIASSEGTAPTTYTVSSSGSRSKTSSFGRDRRRGRRRMAWKESPRQAINGVNSAGEPQKDLPFFCTFCPRAFKTKYEWIRHEDSVHALRTTWICCDTKSSETLQACPFCGQAHPDDAHLAGHKYQQCRSKPESQRTFYRRDHFIQHLHHVHFANTKHPSVRTGCQARLLAAEGHNFGCKDLAMKWRRFGAPMKLDDPMLHCGFCGKKSKDWPERCEHVAEHLVARELDRAVWWSERKENHLENLYSTTPYESFRCRYCQKVFTDVKDMNEHSHCRVWSCRFLRSFDDVAADNAGPPLCPDFPSAKAHHCHLCGSGYRTFHVEHAQNYHRYRSCNQEFYTSEEAFLQHLHNFHGASQPTLLRGSGVIEQSYMRNKGASFEPVEFNESWQPCVMDLDVASVSPFVANNTVSTLPIDHRRSQNQIRKSLVIPKKARDIAQTQDANVKKVSRQRSDTSISKAESHHPRFFRLSTYVPLLSSRIFYSRSAKAADFPRDNQAVLEELPKPHIATLVMSAGTVSMAAARWFIRPDTCLINGMVELTIDSEADAD
ncbi:hypothetical protein BKA58DRAFT_437654 [Alternaria rosae]|uniref:uncharacterized protein n=1 Tax=Alternaria rosae TaxID=1187941 RepID=UPI001E8E7E8F|nr:uncharacterized protein BKA58DRAFT_437654 [Alternaria rosae]KAH6875688.1 hypothetical protein BKA58DRAFT_437654 [Alternaria rosae]